MNACCSEYTPERGCSHWSPAKSEHKTAEDVIKEYEEYREMRYGR